MEDDEEIYAAPIETEQVVGVSALKNSYDALCVNKSNPQSKAALRPPVAAKPKVNKVSALLGDKARVFGELTNNRTSKSYSTKEFNDKSNVFNGNPSEMKVKTDIPLTSSHLSGLSTPCNTSTSKQDKSPDDAPPPLVQKKRFSSALKEIDKQEVLVIKSVEGSNDQNANFKAALQNAQKSDISRGFTRKPESTEVGQNSSLQSEKVDNDSDEDIYDDAAPSPKVGQNSSLEPEKVDSGFRESLYDDAAPPSASTEKRIGNGTGTPAETNGGKTQVSTQRSQVEQGEAETSQKEPSTLNKKESFTFTEKKSSKIYCLCEFKASIESAPEKPSFPKKVNLKKFKPVTVPTREVTLRKRAAGADNGRLPSLPPTADMSMSVMPVDDNESSEDDYETLEETRKKMENRKCAENGDSPESSSNTVPADVYDDAHDAKDAAECEGGENDDVYEAML